MNRFSLLGLLALALAAAAAPQLQLGRRIQIRAGTPEDRELTAIRAASSPQQKLALIEQFAREHPEGDLALLANQLFVETYAALKDYDHVFLYGERVLAADPENLTVATALVAAAAAKGDLDRLFAYGEKVGRAVAQFAAQPPPAGVPLEEWEREKAAALEQARPNLDYIVLTLYEAARQQQDPTRRATLLERFLEAFPQAPAATAAELEVAGIYQRAHQTQQMIAFAQRRVAASATDIPMRLLLADTYSEQGIELERGEQLARQVLDLIAHAEKPANVSAEDWQRQLDLQKGLAYSALGQIYVRQNRDADAVAAFQQAKPLLQTDRVNYARNLYRLGFTLARMKRVAEARAVLNEVVSLNTPYTPLARDVLRKLAGTRAPRP